ncbi:MAG: acetate/propionate family kinase [Anaerolineae bacterium]|nr:acetate/propionate family kinase [Anaerolineae bacterium]
MVTKELARWDMFDNLPPKIADAIREQGEIAPYAPGEVIISVGEPFTFFGVIIEGEAKAYLPAAEGEPLELEVLGAGSFLGEMSLLTGLNCPVDLVASEPSRVLLIPVNLFYRWVQEDPAALQRFSKSIARRSTLIEQKQIVQKQIVAERQAEADPYGLMLTPDTPQRILVLNLRTSSLKYRFFDTDDETRNVEGQVEWIDQPGTLQTHETTRGAYSFELGQAGLRGSLQAALDRLVDPEIGVLASLDEITAVGHRVVHGGTQYAQPVIINDDVLADIRRLAPLAPLHNPVHALGIEWMREILPGVPHVAVFDTAFHQTMPRYAYRYALPEELYTQDGIRRFGFHGTSHHYVGLMAATYLKRRFSQLRLITCHLGAGASVCAIDHGRSIDTSMGFTPLEGMPMVTRSGSIDPAIVTYLVRKGMTADEIDRLLNRESGLKGLSGLSGDTREIADAANAGDRKAMLAAEVFTYELRKYIGAYYAALGGLDVLVFTGGIGENAPGTRSMACQGLYQLGILLDAVKNRAVVGVEEGVVDISHPDSQVKILVVHSDASRMIARETIRILGYEALSRQLQASQIPIPIGVSAHHVHLSQQDVERLFGPGHRLTPRSPLSQPGQFAAEETVKLTGPRGSIDRVRVLGPERKETQIEISRTEGYRLGINAPIRMSGDIEGTPGLTLEGPAGKVEIEEGVIYALRHIHMTPTDARRLGLEDGDTVRVRVEGDRELIFGDVAVRVSPKFQLEIHLDTDEANAAEINSGDVAFLEGIQKRGNRG